MCIWPRARERDCRILEELFAELGYSGYLGALQLYRSEHPREVELLAMSSFLLDYPFANRLYPHALDVLKRLAGFGPTVILSDGDVIFEPRKVKRAGIADAVAGRNHRRYHGSLSNLMPAGVYFGRGQTILLERERIANDKP